MVQEALLIVHLGTVGCTREERTAAAAPKNAPVAAEDAALSQVWKTPQRMHPFCGCHMLQVLETQTPLEANWSVHDIQNFPFDPTWL